MCPKMSTSCAEWNWSFSVRPDTSDGNWCDWMIDQGPHLQTSWCLISTIFIRLWQKIMGVSKGVFMVLVWIRNVHQQWENKSIFTQQMTSEAFENSPHELQVFINTTWFKALQQLSREVSRVVVESDWICVLEEGKWAVFEMIGRTGCCTLWRTREKVIVWLVKRRNNIKTLMTKRIDEKKSW